MYAVTVSRGTTAVRLSSMQVARRENRGAVRVERLRHPHRLSMRGGLRQKRGRGSRCVLRHGKRAIAGVMERVVS